MIMTGKTVSLPIFAISIILTAVIVGAGVYMVMQPAPPEEEVVVTIAMEGMVASFEAVAHTGPAHEIVCYAIYNKLIEADENNQPVPGLATNWTLSDNGLTWTFILRQGVKFHDGTDFNASSVKYNFDKILKDKPSSAYSLFRKVNRTDVIDEYTVAITTNEPYMPLEGNLARSVASIVSPTAYMKWGTSYSHHPAGTGAFKVVDWTPGERIEMVANDEYWGGRPIIDRLIFTKTTDASTRAISAETGQVQLARVISLADVDALEGAGLQLRYEYSDLVFFFLNQGNFSKEVRLAMNYAIDRQSIIDDLFDGRAIMAQSPIPRTCYHYVNVSAYEYNPTLARSLLTQAGYPNGLNTTIWTLNGRYMYDKQVAETVQGYLADVGINAEMIVHDYGTYWGFVKKPLDATTFRMGIVGWCEAPSRGDPDYFMRSMFYGMTNVPVSYNWGYNNSRVNELIDLASRERNLTQQAAYYEEAQELIWGDAAELWLYTQPEITAYSANLKGLRWLPNHCVDFRQAYIE
jgi:ABC-type transport system substrate-binding protein